MFLSVCCLFIFDIAVTFSSNSFVIVSPDNVGGSSWSSVTRGVKRQEVVNPHPPRREEKKKSRSGCESQRGWPGWRPKRFPLSLAPNQMSSLPGSITGAAGRRGKRKGGKRRRRNMRPRWWKSKEHRQRRSSRLSWKYTIGVRTSRAQQQQQQQLNKNDYPPPSDYLEWTEKLKGVNTQCEHPVITISETEDLFEGGNGNSQRLRSYILKKHYQCQRSVEVCLTPTHWSNRRIASELQQKVVLFYFIFKASLLHNSIFCEKFQFIYAINFLSGHKKPLVEDACSQSAHREKMEERRMNDGWKKAATVWENFSLRASKPNYYSEACLVISQTTHKGMIVNHGLTISGGSCQQAAERKRYLAFSFFKFKPWR